MRKFWRWLFPPLGEPTLRPVKLPAYSLEERRELLAALALHPGFELLIGELHNRRCLLERRPPIKTAKSLDDMIAATTAQVEFDTMRRERAWLETEVFIALRNSQRAAADRVAVPDDEPIPAF